MEAIRIKTDIQSTTSQLAALNELSFEHFSHYDKIHERAKKDHKAQPIDLMFGQDNKGHFEPLRWEAQSSELVNEIMAVLPQKLQLLPEEHAQTEITFFTQAFKKPECKKAIITWLKRVAVYNFGVYSKTMLYPDNTPVGFWATILLGIHHPEEMTVVTNFISSMNLPNFYKKKWDYNDSLYGFELPGTIAACHYIYRTQGWNHETLNLLCTQIIHYWYTISDVFPGLLKVINPEKYLLEADHLEQFLSLFKKCHKALIEERSQGDVVQIVENIFPLMMDGDQLESIKEGLIEELV
ncbi:MAG: hypothetical protein JEZ14_24060 [Marinilabiliaceae bacterium]|nr:hypothetical protein [Marinilabiliaceae bacterium]